MFLENIKIKRKNASLPNEIKIHGVIVKKMPNGKYIDALNTLESLPTEFLAEMELTSISELFNIKNLSNIIMKLLKVAPTFTLKFLAKLIGIEEDKMFNELNPAETIDILEKFAEMNDLESFFQKMKAVIKKAQKSITGFKGQ